MASSPLAAAGGLAEEMEIRCTLLHRCGLGQRAGDPREPASRRAAPPQWRGQPAGVSHEMYRAPLGLQLHPQQKPEFERLRGCERDRRAEGESPRLSGQFEREHMDPPLVLQQWTAAPSPVQQVMPEHAWSYMRSRREVASQLLLLQRLMSKKHFMNDVVAGVPSGSSAASSSTASERTPCPPPAPPGADFGSLRDALAHICGDGGDLSRVLAVRRIRSLGRQPKLLLQEHFGRFGLVEGVVTYLVYKPMPGKGRSARLGDMAFVVMASPDCTRQCLAAGETAAIHGSIVPVSRFQPPAPRSEPTSPQWQ